MGLGGPAGGGPAGGGPAGGAPPAGGQPSGAGGGQLAAGCGWSLCFAFSAAPSRRQAAAWLSPHLVQVQLRAGRPLAWDRPTCACGGRSSRCLSAIGAGGRRGGRAGRRKPSSHRCYAPRAPAEAQAVLEPLGARPPRLLVIIEPDRLLLLHSGVPACFLPHWARSVGSVNDAGRAVAAPRSSLARCRRGRGLWRCLLPGRSLRRH